MLPRNLLARAGHLKVTNPHHRLVLITRSSIPTRTPSVFQTSHFHSSSRRHEELPKSPFQTFVEVLREEIRKNREIQEGVKHLHGEVESVRDSEAMRRAKEAYERARLTTSIRENPRLRAAAEDLKKRGEVLGDAVSEAIRTMDESEFMKSMRKASEAVSKGVANATEPIRNTEAYKTLADTVLEALDDSGSIKHAGYEEKEARRKRRQMRLTKAGLSGIAKKRTAVNPEAGQALILHANAERRDKWEAMKETNPFLRQFVSAKKLWEESENPVISSMRGVTGSVSGFLFNETENAQVTRMLRAIDPSYDPETFQRELREYIIPEVIDAYLSADQQALKVWCGEATYNVLWATLETYLKQGLMSDSKVLDIRQVDVTNGKIMENDIPVLIVTCTTQEVLLFRDRKTREVVVGQENKVEQCTYFAALTRIPEEMDNEITGGWKVIEMGRRASRAYL